MAMNPVDRIRLFGSGRIRILPDPEKTLDIRPDQDPDPDLVHL